MCGGKGGRVEEGYMLIFDPTFSYVRDGRLRPGDELLMVDGKSLVGLTHNEVVDILKSSKRLVQLVVAMEVRNVPLRSHALNPPLLFSQLYIHGSSFSPQFTFASPANKFSGFLELHQL